MRHALVESYVRQLRSSLQATAVPVEEDMLRSLYDRRSYGGLVGVIKKIMHLELRIRLGLVNNGGPNAPAWVQCPDPMPLYGSSEFCKIEVPLYLRKSFLREVEFEQVVCAIAHELAHVVLHSLRHPLRTEEEAVDLTAMLLGFRDFYMTGCVQSFRGHVVYQQGYLSEKEICYAAHYMTFR